MGTYQRRARQAAAQKNIPSLSGTPKLSPEMEKMRQKVQKLEQDRQQSDKQAKIKKDLSTNKFRAEEINRKYWK